MAIKWTKERLVKFQKTMAAKRLAKPKSKTAKPDKGIVKDIQLYLRHSRRATYKRIRAGNEITSGELYALLALNELEQKL